MPSLPKNRNGVAFFAAADQNRSRRTPDPRDERLRISRRISRQRSNERIEISTLPLFQSNPIFR